jgi:MFS family permease
LRHRDFRLYWIGSVIEQVGAWMQNIAQGWLVYELTGSAFLVGLNGLFLAGPFICSSLYAGTIVDRVDRRKLLIWIGVASTIINAIVGMLVFTGHIAIWHIYVSSVAHSLVGGFESPARQALLPHLVPRSDLMTAISLNSIIRKGAQIIGPALGGIFVASFGIAGAYFIHVGANMVRIWSTVAMHVETPPAGDAHANTGRAILDGLVFVRGNSIIAAVLVLESVMSLFGSYHAMMVIFAKDIFGMGPEGLGLLQSAAGVGSVVGSMALAAAGDVHRKGRLLTIAGIIHGAALVAFAFCPWFLLALPLLALVGASDIWFSATRITILQLITPKQMLGRVMSLSSISMRGLGGLGNFQTGTMSALVGVPAAVAIGAVVCAACTLLYAWRVPALRNFTGSGEREAALAAGAADPAPARSH